MEGIALKYESIIRIIHKVERLEIPAANADIYRSLEKNFVLYRDNNNSKKNEELLFNYGFKYGEVATNLCTAINVFEKRFDDRLTDQDKKDIEKIKNSLVNDRMEKNKIEKIDQSIELIEKLLKRYRLIV